MDLLIEETEALANVEATAACSPRLEALILGFGDFSASQGMRLSLHGQGEGKYPGDPWSYHRNRMIVAARANGLDAIDGPFADFRDDAGYRREATWASALGAVGKWAIHPAQVPIANDVYSPTEGEIQRAQRVIAQVRRVLGDSAKASRYIETVPTRGYRFIVPVTPRKSLICDSAAVTALRSSLPAVVIALASSPIAS